MMQYKYWLSLALPGLLWLFCRVCSPVWAAPAPEHPNEPAPISPAVKEKKLDSRFEAFTLQAGTSLQVVTQTPISTAYSRVGDPVEAVVNQNIYLRGRKLIPESTRMFGEVSRVDPPLLGGDGVLAVRFNRIMLNAGEESLPIKAHVRTERDDQTWGGGATRGTVPYSSVQRVWVNREYARTQYGGQWAMGKHIEKPPGEHWVVIMEESLIIVRPRSSRRLEDEDADLRVEPGSVF